MSGASGVALPVMRELSVKNLTFALPILAALVPMTAHAEAVSGARAEVTFGYDHVGSDDDYDLLPTAFDGARIGGAIGYDFAVSPNLLVGVEADAGWTLGSAKTVTLGRDRATQKLGRDLGVSVRVTMPVSQATALFAKVGYANSRLNLRYEAGLTNGYDTEDSHFDRSGLRLGAGVQHALSEKLYLKAEYRWTRYGGKALGYLTHPSRNQLLFGLGTRF